MVWDVKKGKKHAEMGWETPKGVVYAFKRIRYRNHSNTVTIERKWGSEFLTCLVFKWSKVVQ